MEQDTLVESEAAVIARLREHFVGPLRPAAIEARALEGVEYLMLAERLEEYLDQLVAAWSRPRSDNARILTEQEREASLRQREVDLKFENEILVRIRKITSCKTIDPLTKRAANAAEFTLATR